VDWPASGLPRFLVVDADPTCRLAAWSPLKQAFNEPDIARAGRAALELAAGKAYDVIFLDVDMPGLNEVCARIHQTKLNFNTPIVFVTSHDDFDRLAASISPGGHDLIGKPFLAFEITAKALTLVLRAGGPRRENFLPRMPIPVAAVAGEAAIS